MNAVNIVFRPEIGLHELNFKQDEKIRENNPGTGGKLHNKLLNAIIDIAEEQLKIDIRKILGASSRQTP